ncbi:MAG TPA: thioesterase family protein [Mycobacteriales bacterium]|nr:thioesterase family protein [Mycobacteriales bacterium]
MSDWDDVTSLRRRGETGVFDADLHPGWAIVGKPNGGYTLAILARAACEVVEAAHPLAISAHYLRAPSPGPVEVHAEAIRRGRRVSTARAALWEDGKPCIEALVTCGDLVADPVIEWDAIPAPPMPPPEECPAGSNPHFHVELFDHAELRVDPATAPFPQASGEPAVRFWFRLRDGTEPDVRTLLLAADAGPPTVFNLEKYGWAPTVELTVLVRGIPAPGWLLVATEAQFVSGGWFDEQAFVWDSTGRLVAQARQLALIGT